MKLKTLKKLQKGYLRRHIGPSKTRTKRGHENFEGYNRKPSATHVCQNHGNPKQSSKEIFGKGYAGQY